MRKRFIAALGACLSIILVTSACSSSDDASGDEEIRIAALMPLQGPAAQLGETYASMLEQVVKDTNDAGGIEIKGNKHKIALKVFTGTNTPESGLAQAREAVNDGYNIIIGPLGSPATTGAQTFLGAADALWMVNAQVAGPTTYPNAFRPTQRAAVFDDAMVAWLKQHDEIQRVAILTNDQYTGVTEHTKALIADIEATGRTVVADEGYSPNEANFRPAITKMMAKDPDVYVQRGYPAELSPFVKQTSELVGQDAVRLTTTVSTDAGTRKVYPDLSVLKNVFVTAPLSHLDPFVTAGNKRAVELSSALGAENLDVLSTWSHDLMQTLKVGLSKADSLKTKDLIAAMKSLDVKDIDGVTLNTYTPMPNGHLFGKDRESQYDAYAMEWDTDKGWVIQEKLSKSGK